VNSVGSKNSLRRRRVKLRKKSLTTANWNSSNNNKKSESDEIQDFVSKNILKTMSRSSDSYNTTLMEDLSTAISLMTIVKQQPVYENGSNCNNHHHNNHSTVTQKPESDDDEQAAVMKAPDFKIGSLTNVYGNPHAMNLGSLAALANYNSNSNSGNNNNNNKNANNNENGEMPDCDETGNENLESSFSEHNMWDNYMEKYNSEAYSEDRDIDGARKLLEFGDDYRNFIDSQSDCCSSLSNAANQLDSLSPPRNRKNISASLNQNSASLSSSNDNSMKVLRQRRIQELPETERRRLSNGGEGKKKIKFSLSILPLFHFQYYYKFIMCDEI
jgi:hypothetical protein